MSDMEKVRARLGELRVSIDNIDSALVHMLAERFRRTHEVGVLKAEHGMPALDAAREAEQVARLSALAERSGLDPDLMKKIFQMVVEKARMNHRAIAEERRPATRDENA